MMNTYEVVELMRLYHEEIEKKTTNEKKISNAKSNLVQSYKASKE